MIYTTLGRTGLRVSVAGLGCGGFSKLGLARGATERQAADVVLAALDEGVNFIDTAESYGTERAVGLALAGRKRDEVVVSTKTALADGKRLRDADEVVASLHGSLERLGMEHVDVFHLHGVRPEQLSHAREVLVPALQREMEAGRIGHLGITETSPRDPHHTMLDEAVDGGPFEVVMLAFHLMHQNARARLFPRCLETRTGTLAMFVVRQVFSQPGLLETTLAELARDGQLPASLADSESPLDFIAPGQGRAGIIEAAYRYARHEPGVDVVLFGTGSIAHVQSNVDAILGDALPPAVQQQIADTFGHLVGVGLVAPKG